MPFIALNCANLSETLLESQLFGHIKGAFTGADKDQEGLFSAADGGTLFLDEVVEIPPSLQAKLLRVLQEREFTPLGTTKPQSFDIKIISAAAQSLENAVKEGSFREDLRYRLEVMPVYLPPLRARPSDIKMLFDHYLKIQFLRHGYELIHVDSAVYDCIGAYYWPGNIRELVNVCTYIAALSGHDGEVTKSSLPPALTLARSAFDDVKAIKTEPVLAPQRPLKLTKETLAKAISEHDGHRESIAKAFGISRMTLWRKMKEFDLIDQRPGL
jgi:transcriptional regulator with PAS, ATPase and Fis domain